jgi:hypothetical protein
VCLLIGQCDVKLPCHSCPKGLNGKQNSAWFQLGCKRGGLGDEIPEMRLCPEYDCIVQIYRTNDLEPYEHVNECSELAVKRRREALSLTLGGNICSPSLSLHECMQDLKSAYSKRKDFSGEEESSSDSILLHQCVFFILWDFADCIKLQTIQYPKNPRAKISILKASILLRPAAEYQAKDGKVSKI